MKRIILIAALCAATLTALDTNAANAALLINPAGGTTLSGFVNAGGVPGDSDDGRVTRTLGVGNFPLYGTTLTSINVTTNGYLTTTNGIELNDTTITNLATFSGGSVIAPLFDDLNLVAGGSIRESVTSDYYAVTYDINNVNNTTNNANVRSVFQVALFKAATTQGGIAFLRGDIFFSYGNLNAPVNLNNFTVGVGRNGVSATGAFVTTGQFTTVANFFNNFDEANEGILFRSASGGTTTAPLTASAVGATVVPEAGSLALLLPALGVGIGVVVRRRRAA